MQNDHSRVLSTAVIGAGPAGLLFCLIGKILMADTWQVRLYDKRQQYVRTHRLRISPEPYFKIQKTLSSSHFDALILFLEQHHFSPEVNLLEAQLSELLAELGVEKEIREITSLNEIQADTIVAADSVNSTIRELIRDNHQAKKFTHEQVARLRITGANLPKRLAILDHFRLAKVLGSFVDYRMNRNGFVEIDLFLSQKEYLVLQKLEASPKNPVPIHSSLLSNTQTPLLQAIIRHLEQHNASIVLQSTFRLEHIVMPKFSFQQASTRIFLVGDAGVSLPFFRGMACLAACAFALAKVHQNQQFDTYDASVNTIVQHELVIVRSRARIVHGLRELIRISSLLPFPIQSWWLSAARDPLPDQIAPSTFFNALIAVTAAGCAFLGFVSPLYLLPAVCLQICGGIAYRWTFHLEPPPHRFLRRVWEIQIALLGISGIALTLFFTLWVAAFWWWVMGIVFALGIYIFEGIILYQFKNAKLEEDI